MTHLYVGVPLLETVRASAALQAAGAWDQSEAILVAGCTHVTFFFEYTRGGAGGSVEFYLEGRPAAETNWFRMALLQNAAVVAGADTQSAIQRETVTYEATGAAVERFMYVLAIDGTFEGMRLSACERGAVGTPGTLRVVAQKVARYA